MVTFLKFACVVMMFYGIYGVYRGQIWSGGNYKARTVVREVEPITFWLVCGSYVLLGALLLFVLINKFG